MWLRGFLGVIRNSSIHPTRQLTGCWLSKQNRTLLGHFWVIFENVASDYQGFDNIETGAEYGELREP